MNFTQLSAYLQAYLETNDAAVIGNIPNFMTLAAARISTDLRSSLIEQTSPLLAQQTQPLPDGFIAATLLKHNTAISGYVTPTAFNELSGTGFNCYTLLSGQISINPSPAVGDVIDLSYYVAGDESLSSRLPHLFLHGAAMEAELYQGNTADAQIESQLYQQDLQQANGWDIQSGPISLGGAAKALAVEPLALNTTPTMAVDVSYAPAPGVFSTNVQAAITEVQGNLSSHTGDLNNPHQTSAVQVGAIPYVAPGPSGNILSSDGTDWQSVDPSIAVAGVAEFNGRTGAVLPIIDDYHEWFAQTPITVTDNSVVLFDGTDGRTQKVGPLISDLATVASLGTAATRNVQTSAADTTAGRLLAVGAFGLGGNSPTVPSDDCNLVEVGGFYSTSSGTLNVPVGVASGSQLLHMSFNSGASATETQLIIGRITGAQRMWFRSKAVGTWQAWTEVVTGAKQTSTADTTSGRIQTIGAINWITPTLQNGFTVDSSGFLGFQYSRVGQQVRIRGRVERASAPAADTIIFTAPAGYTPSGGVFRVPLNNVYMQDAAGNTQVWSASIGINGEVSLGVPLTAPFPAAITGAVFFDMNLSYLVDPSASAVLLPVEPDEPVVEPL